MLEDMQKMLTPKPKMLPKPAAETHAKDEIVQQDFSEGKTPLSSADKEGITTKANAAVKEVV
eukprot:2542829-Karenia_brevis.AAC.1